MASQLAVKKLAAFLDQDEGSAIFGAKAQGEPPAYHDEIAPGVEARLLIQETGEYMSYPELCLRIKPPKSVIKDLFNLGEVGLIYGASTAGKSFLTMDMLWHIANGRDWFGWKIKNAHQVVYFALEGINGVGKRVRAIEENKGLAGLKNFTFVNTSLDLRNLTQLESHAQRMAERGIESPVIVIDTLAQASPGVDENTSASMGLVIQGAQHLAQITGGVVIMIHHAGKDLGRGARGWSGLKGAMDFQIDVSMENDQRKWIVEKVKDGKSGDAFVFKLDVVELTLPDSDGDPITTCLIKPDIDHGSNKLGIEALKAMVTQHISNELRYGNKPTLTSICAALKKAAKRADIRDAIAVLISENKIFNDKNTTAGRGGSRTFLNIS